MSLSYTDSGEPFGAHHRVNPVRVNYPVRHQRATNNQPGESNAQPASSASTESPASAPADSKVGNIDQPADKLESTKKTDERTHYATNSESKNEPGPSGLQTQNQNNKSPKASQSNPSDVNNGVNGNNEPGPSNRNATGAAAAAASNQQNVETRQRLIIVHHRRHNGNDENGNMNRYDNKNSLPFVCFK